MNYILGERYFYRNNRMRYLREFYGYSHADLAASENLSISQVARITAAHPPLYVYKAIPRWMLLCELAPALDVLFDTGGCYVDGTKKAFVNIHNDHTDHLGE